MPLHPLLQNQLDPTDDDMEHACDNIIEMLKGKVHDVQWLDSHHLILTYHAHRVMIAHTPDGLGIALEECPTC